MAASQTVSEMTSSRREDRDEAAVAGLRSYARMAGIGLLVALASIIAVYAGSGAIAGTRPDNATDAAAVSAFYNHSQLAFFFWQAVISAMGIAFFALAFGRYLHGFAHRPVVRQLADFGVALALIETPVVVVEFGVQISLVRLAGLGDPSLLGVFMAWNWIDNGTMLILEPAWLAFLSLAAWMSGALPRWLAGYGGLVSLLLVVLAVPGLMLNYPLGIALGAYGPFMVWFLVTGIYLARGGRAPVAES